MNRQNYFLGGIIESVVGGVSDFIGGVSDFFSPTDDFLSSIPDDLTSDVITIGSEGQFQDFADYQGFLDLVEAEEAIGSFAAPSFFEQASDRFSDFFSGDFLKSGAGFLAKEGAKQALGARRASSSQQQARAMRSQVLGAGRGIGVSGSAPARQFAPGSVRSMIARTNAGRQAFQPGTVDTRQNVVNIISDAFAQTSATTPTGAGKISPSSSKIAKVGTSYFKGTDTV